MKDIKYFKRDSNQRLSYSIPRFNDTVTGIDVLVQIVFNHLLTTPGTDVVNTKRGGGLYAILRKANSDRNTAIFIGAAVARVKSDIIAEQDSLDLSPDESLKNLEIKSIVVDSANTSVDITLTIESDAGEIRELKI